MYTAPFAVFAAAWSGHGRVALGSFQEAYANKVHVVRPGADGAAVPVCEVEIDHPFPPTRLQWAPSGAQPLLASSGDHLRVWDGVTGKQRAVLTNDPHKGAAGAAAGAGAGGAGGAGCTSAAPLTSFDWNPVQQHLIGTASIDTTCTIWDIEKGQAQTQLIAHDREVFDICFANDAHVFASVGADGSLRMFDLRNLEHSTILFETPDSAPLLRVAWNRVDPNYIATFAMDSSRVSLIDIREPSQAVAEVRGHTHPVNAIAWDPSSAVRLCTVGDDAAAHVWDVTAVIKSPTHAEPVASHRAEAPINQAVWSRQGEQLALAFDSCLQIVPSR